MKRAFLVFLQLAAAVAIAGQEKIAAPPAVKTPFPEALQAVIVTSKNWDASAGTARIFERSSARSKWKYSGRKFDVALGRSGMRWAIESAPEGVSEFKKEGDGRSPAGLFPLGYAFGSGSSIPGTSVPFRKIEEFTECVDDPASGHYNTIVDRMRVGNFDWKSSEKMLEIGAEYELGIFVAYNSYPVRKGDGSCIFLHIWKDSSTPTSGCTAMARGDLEKIAKWLDPAKNPYLVQLPETEYRSLTKAWGLPKLK
jgi:L,D-peptidoglycan transpeptidase YkuD (ErfK/YbiS/YcfS/YnhG family)